MYDFQIINFIRLLKETDKSYLLQLTLDTAVWVPKSQTDKLDIVFGEAKLLNTFKVGGKNQEYVVYLNQK